MDYESFRLSHSLVGEYLKRSMTWLQIVSFMKITLHSISPSVLKANSRVIKVVVPTRKLVSRNVLLEFQSTSEIRRTESYAANSDGGEGGPGNSWLRRTLFFVGPGKLWIYGSVALSVFTCRDALPSAWKVQNRKPLAWKSVGVLVSCQNLYLKRNNRQWMI